ncbi:hypothetical protein, partial [Embleya sp. NPDC059259]|uniref:hypothetical protein n=1 Tax=Embleya sp. NPDC059259 TaxID=3346796 RepID=UPI0036755F0E
MHTAQPELDAAGGRSVIADADLERILPDVRTLALPVTPYVLLWAVRRRRPVGRQRADAVRTLLGASGDVVRLWSVDHPEVTPARPREMAIGHGAVRLAPSARVRPGTVAGPS